MTFQLGDVVKANEAISRSEDAGAAHHVISEAIDWLQFKVATMVDNSLPHMPQAQQKSGRPIKSISARLKVSSFHLRKPA